MKLISCYIANFGVLHEFTYSFESGLNVILEDNGWGKSTFASFLKCMFYGMDYSTKRSLSENDRKHYAPWQGGRFGGYLIFEVNDKKYRIERFFGNKDKEDTYKLYNEQTGLETNDYGDKPGEEIFGIDEEAFIRSIFIPQQSLFSSINDSLTAKMSNVSFEDGNVDRFEKSIAAIDKKIKVYQRNGGKGQIPELESLIAETDRQISILSNKTDSVESLKNKKAELDVRRKQLVDELKNLQEENKRTREYDIYKAKKTHYESLTKKALETKSRVDSLSLFFEKPNLCEEFDKRNDDYDALCDLVEKHKDESENLKELEYKKHSINNQYQANKKTPVANFILMIFGCLIMGACLYVWYMGYLDTMYAAIGAFVGFLMLTISIIVMVIVSAKIKRVHKIQIEEIDEEIDVSRASVKEMMLRIEQQKRALINYVNGFAVTNPENIAKSLSEIESKINELNHCQREKDEAGRELSTFESENEIEKIRTLKTPHYSLDEIERKEAAANNTLMEIMEEKNDVARRMDALLNSDEDEADLLQARENYKEQLKECRKDYEILSITKEFLNSANDNFKVTYIAKMKQAFADYVKILNGCTIEEIAIDANLNVTMIQDGKSQSIESFSTGIRDMVYLCSRFALAKSMYGDSNPFFIIDDPLVNFDQKRIANAMEFLKEVAKDNQIIYFTCHESRT